MKFRVDGLQADIDCGYAFQGKFRVRDNCLNGHIFYNGLAHIGRKATRYVEGFIQEDDGLILRFLMNPTKHNQHRMGPLEAELRKNNPPVQGLYEGFWRPAPQELWDVHNCASYGKTTDPFTVQDDFARIFLTLTEVYF
ncbi:MAG: hypothetical protein ACQESG_06600 [Nanobdellota archaeon]